MAKSKKVEKITEEELTQLTTIKERVAALKSSMGAWMLKEETLKDERVQLSNVLQDIKKQELELTQQLNEKYGAVNISLVTGEITSAE